MGNGAVVKLAQKLANRSMLWREQANSEKKLAEEEQELIKKEEQRVELQKRERISRFRKENKPFNADKNKHMGSLAVQLFITKVMEKGGSCSIPIGDEQAYDVIVDVGGSLLRVQVKSTWTCVYKTNGERCVNRCRVILAKGAGCKKPYHTDDADVLAIYAQPLNHWDIIWSDQIDGISHSFNSSQLKPTDWGLLGL